MTLLKIKSGRLIVRPIGPGLQVLLFLALAVLIARIAPPVSSSSARKKL